MLGSGERVMTTIAEVRADHYLIKLPVTLLAKWKTTLQLFALTGELVVACWAAFGLPPEPAVLGPATIFAHVLLWIAAAVTLITGAQYWEQARKALEAQDAPAP